MGQRIYKMIFDNVSIAAIQDVLSMKAGAANGIEIHQIDLSAGGVTSPAEIRLRLKRLSAAVTQGTGGTVLTPSSADSGDTKASTATVRANDTAQATTTGTTTFLGAWQWNVQLQWQYLPAPEDRLALRVAAWQLKLVLLVEKVAKRPIEKGGILVGVCVSQVRKQRVPATDKLNVLRHGAPSIPRVARQ